MNSIFIVTAGAYDDYHIVACFSTLAKAEAFMAAVPSDQDTEYHPVQELELDTPIVDQLAEGLEFWDITMRKDGSVHGYQTGEHREFRFGALNEYWLVNWDGTTKPFQLVLRGIVLAKTEAEAVAQVDVMRLQAIADGWWDTTA